MNKARRRTLNDAISRLQEVEGILEVTKDEEQEAFDNLNESLQDSERGDTMSAAISAMESAITSVQEAIAELENAVNG